MENKSRHGCLTAWLILVIISNSIMSLVYLLKPDDVVQKSSKEISANTVIVLAIIGILNVFFSAMLLRWKKWAFWGCAISAVVVFIMNVTNGYGFMSIFGLIGILILYGLFQIKKNDIKGWDNLS